MMEINSGAISSKMTKPGHLPELRACRHSGGSGTPWDAKNTPSLCTRLHVQRTGPTVADAGENRIRMSPIPGSGSSLRYRRRCSTSFSSETELLQVFRKLFVCVTRPMPSVQSAIVRRFRHGRWPIVSGCLGG